MVFVLQFFNKFSTCSSLYKSSAFTSSNSTLAAHSDFSNSSTCMSSGNSLCSMELAPKMRLIFISQLSNASNGLARVSFHSSTHASTHLARNTLLVPERFTPAFSSAATTTLRSGKATLRDTDGITSHRVHFISNVMSTAPPCVWQYFSTNSESFLDRHLSFGDKIILSKEEGGNFVNVRRLSSSIRSARISIEACSSFSSW
mmetsp:Transcript_25077/g.54052  ORF Transcript_25077/g.54052 Transcript_25077/m.54052 type:complete len:202 (-) Transcript_25077:1189-1794(-)